MRPLVNLPIPRKTVKIPAATAPTNNIPKIPRGQLATGPPQKGQLPPKVKRKAEAPADMPK